MSSLERLTTEMQDEHRKWARSTRAYGTINPTLRTFLIVASAAVSARNALEGSPLSFLVWWVPVLALAITVLTAVDSWLKPRDKWRGFMTDRDDLADLIIQAGFIQSADHASLDKLRAEFSDLRRRHREKNVY
jgi:hypothetical protein